MKQRCAICYKAIDPNCNWHQGRCPHRKSMVEEIVNDNYKARYHNLIHTIKNLFKK